jgi:hypothetical protein
MWLSHHINNTRPFLFFPSPPRDENHNVRINIMVATRSTRSAAKKAPEVAAPPSLKAPPKRAPRKKAAVANVEEPAIEKLVPALKPAPRKRAALIEKPAELVIADEKPAPRKRAAAPVEKAILSEPAPAERLSRKAANIEKTVVAPKSTKKAAPVEIAVTEEKPAPGANTTSKRTTRVATESAQIATEAPQKRGRKAAIPPPVAELVSVSAPVEDIAPTPVDPIVAAPVLPLTKTRATRAARTKILVSPLKTKARKRPTTTRTRTQVPAKKTVETVDVEPEQPQVETQIQEETVSVVPASKVVKSVNIEPEEPQEHHGSQELLKPQEPQTEVLVPTEVASVVESLEVIPSPIREVQPSSPTEVSMIPSPIQEVQPSSPAEVSIISSPIMEQNQPILPTPIVVRHPIFTAPVLSRPVFTSPVREKPAILPQPIPEQDSNPPSPVMELTAVPIPFLVHHPIFTMPAPTLSVVRPPIVEQPRPRTPPMTSTMLPPPVFASPVKSALRSPKKLQTKTPKKQVSWTAPSDDFESSLLVQDGPLTGTVFYVDVTSNGKSQNHLFTGLLEDLGAQVVRDWTSGLTHVLYKDGCPETLEKVASHSSIKCVNIGWALDCEKEKKRIDEAAYLVKSTPVNAPIVQSKKLNPYTPAKTPSRYMLEEGDTSIASIPATPTSSEFDRSIAYDDKGIINEEKENSFISSSYFAQIAKKGQQTCPPKSRVSDDFFGVKSGFGGSFLSKTPTKTASKPAFLKATPVRPWTSVKRKPENIGGITMAPAKRLRWD